MTDEPSYEEIQQWKAKKEYERQLKAHPDPRDPDHPEDPMERKRDRWTAQLIDSGECDEGGFAELMFDLGMDELFRHWLEIDHAGNRAFFTTKDPAELIRLRDSLKTYMADRLTEEL